MSSQRQTIELKYTTVYYGFTYLFVPDVIVIIDRGRPEQGVVTYSCGNLWIVNDT